MVNKRVTLKDIARELNVSVTTISKAINQHPDISRERRAQIMEKLAERNYVPNSAAQNLRSAKTKFVSIIVSDNTNPYYAKVIKGVETVLSKRGYLTLIFNNNEDPASELALIRELLSVNVAGVLITPAMGNKESVRLLEDNGIPHVLVHRYIDKDRGTYVVADDVEVAYVGAKYLIENHGPQVAFINASERISSASDRLLGYKRALQEAGIPFDERLLIDDVINQEQGYEAASNILSRVEGKCSILCFSDYIATGVMLRVHESNLRIPDDVAIMGIDGIEMFSYFYPGLTTVHLPKFELGAKSAEVLLDMIDQEENFVSQKIVFAPKLIIRGTA